MDYIIIGLLIVILILVVISLFKNINEGNITERLGRLEVNMMKEMGELIVQRKNKNTVRELATGIDIPLILLEISTNKHSDATLYSYELVGDTSSQALVFGITKTEGIPFQEDETFKLQEATEEEVAYYLECTKSAIWQETLVDIVEGAENRKREYQEEYKKGKKLHHQEMVRSLIKK